MDETTVEKKSHPLVPFLICQTLCFVVAFVGSQASMTGLQAWYPSLNKPAFTPPGWIFAPVWAALFFLMGIALWQVWRSEASNARSRGLALFGVQLTLNGLWSWIFFAWNKLPLAFIEILVLDLAILATILVFNRIRSSAAWLMVPYLAWCCFATLLTFSIWRMNPTNVDPNSEDIQIRVGESEVGSPTP
jgi:translocator protein